MKVRVLFVVPFLSMLLLPACKGMEKSEGITADIEAAMMEGRRAAVPFATTTVQDSALLKQQLFEARNPSREYRKAGKTKEANAFDSTFTSTIRTLNAPLLTLMK